MKWGGYPPLADGIQKISANISIFAQKTLSLGLFLTKKKINKKGRYPPPIGDGKTNKEKFAERGDTPPSLTDDSRDSGF